MSTCSEPHLACHHTGYDFDWWRCKEGGHVGRPPSPFPASFETSRKWRPDSTDSRSETTAPADGQTNGTTGAVINGACSDDIPSNDKDGFQYVGDGSNGHRLFWPLFEGPKDTEPVQTEDFGNVDASAFDSKKKKTQRLPYHRPPWIPTKMPNKWGVAGHPPPYTNYCRETLFNTRTADPAKVRSLAIEVSDMEFQSPGGVCCRRPPEHSHQFFDWWRVSCDGMIVQAPLPPPAEPPLCPFPLKKSELCWPLAYGCDGKPPDNACKVDIDFWPDKADSSAKRVNPHTQCLPWMPAKLPNKFGVIKYPPPYTRYCRDREKPLNFVCKA